MDPLWKRPLAWGFVVAAVLVAVLVTFSYVGGFLNPQGNMDGVPIAVVNEDAGATLGGQPVKLGDQVVAQITTANPAIGDAVAWQVLPSRERAVEELDKGASYAAIVIPSDYSARVAALFDPATQSAPAQIEILTNPAAGSFAGAEAQQIAAGLVARVSAETNARLTQALSTAGASVAPTAAQVVGNPVQATITVAEPVGEKSGRGLAPFYFAVMLAIAAYMSVSIVNVAVDVLSGVTHLEFLAARVRGSGSAASRLAVWRAKLGFSLVAAVGGGLAATWIAVGVLGMETTKGLELGAFAALAVAAVTMITLAFLTAFGQIGLVLALFFSIIYGVPASGGVYPREMVSDLFRGLGWLPLRYVVDGARALMFYDGRGSAGLSTASWALLGYAFGAAALGAATAWVLDRGAARRAVPEHRPAGQLVVGHQTR